LHLEESIQDKFSELWKSKADTLPESHGKEPTGPWGALSHLANKWTQGKKVGKPGARTTAKLDAEMSSCLLKSDWAAQDVLCGTASTSESGPSFFQKEKFVPTKRKSAAAQKQPQSLSKQAKTTRSIVAMSKQIQREKMKLDKERAKFEKYKENHKTILEQYRRLMSRARHVSEQ